MNKLITVTAIVFFVQSIVNDLLNLDTENLYEYFTAIIMAVAIIFILKLRANGGKNTN